MNKKNTFRNILIPIMLILSSAIMAMAWLGHLKYKEDLSFLMATLFAWLLVLPEYLLNVSAIRWGVGVYQPSEMAAMKREITPHKGGRTEAIYFRATPEVKAKLQALAEKLGISVADLIESLVEDAQ